MNKQFGMIEPKSTFTYCSSPCISLLLTRVEFRETMQLLVIAFTIKRSVFCLSTKSYRARKPEQSQDKRQNNQGKQLN